MKCCGKHANSDWVIMCQLVGIGDASIFLLYAYYYNLRELYTIASIEYLHQHMVV